MSTSIHPSTSKAALLAASSGLPSTYGLHALLYDFEMLTNFMLRLPVVCGLDPAGPDRKYEAP